jgi:hypothetical protein
MKSKLTKNDIMVMQDTGIAMMVPCFGTVPQCQVMGRPDPVRVASIRQQLTEIAPHALRSGLAPAAPMPAMMMRPRR